MKILAAGGGSGGHVTPVVAVLKEIRAQHPRTEIRFWCDFSFATQAKSTVAHFDASIPVQRIVAGKLRRYHHLSLLQQLFWPRLVLSNIGDGFLVGVGVIQSLFKLIVWRPDVVFTKGGYVCLPIGFAAHMLRIPLVIHDSDAHPGLTNRILSRWAAKIATGAPLEYYSYPKAKARYIGIPVANEFRPFNKSTTNAARMEWGIDPDRPLTVVTGGGLGAQRINDTVAKVLKDLLKKTSVVLVAGAGQYDELRAFLPPNNERFQLYPFVTGMATLLGAADVVVTRAGATTILELAALKKPTILIPNAKLTGGHQLKNAAVYEAKAAVISLNEEAVLEQPQLLVEAITSLLNEPEQAKAMAERFYAFSKPNAAKDMASLILSARK
jgi:UDP-N-acetylglucosamine--N-acetylmuramyl-(pentapeptide) pyrophosphoryl-undecaprenol N-acetylglucosamine transferase